MTQINAPAAVTPVPIYRRTATWAMAAAAVVVIGIAALLAASYKTELEPGMPSFLSTKVFSGNADKDSFDWTTRSFFRRFAESLRADLASFTPNTGGVFTVAGTRQTMYAGEPVLEVCVDCAGSPAKVVVAKRGGRAATEMGKALAVGLIKASRPMGDFLVAIVNSDAPEQLVNLVVSPSSSVAAVRKQTTTTPSQTAKRLHTPAESAVPVQPVLPHIQEERSVAQGGAPGLDGPVTQMDALIRGFSPSAVLPPATERSLADVVMEGAETPGTSLSEMPVGEDIGAESPESDQPSRAPRAAGPI